MNDRIPREMIATVKLRYQAELGQCSEQPCPNPKKFAPQSRIAYRFVRKECTEADFVPKPNGQTSCEAHALSFWDSLAQAQAKYRSLAEAHNDNGVTAIQKYGDHIVDVEIDVDHGVMSLKAAKSGHRALHPFEDAEFADDVGTCVRCEYLDECDS